MAYQLSIRFAAAVIAAITLLTAPAPGAQSRDEDPYDILRRHYQAMGGVERLKAVKTVYMEGSIDLIGTGLKGTFTRWSSDLMKYRTEVDLGTMRQVDGDNGSFRWVVDHNNKLQLRRDSVTLRERVIDSLRAEFEELNPASPWFDIELVGTEDVGAAACYVLRTTNAVNQSVRLDYYDRTTHYILKTVTITPDDTTTTLLSDYRAVGDFVRPFVQTTTTNPPGMTQKVVFTRIEQDIPVPAELFEPPDVDVRDFVFANGVSAERIPFEYIENHIYLPVVVDGDTGLWILDSGAGSTVIDKAYAERHGIEREGDIKGQGAGNVVDVSFGRMPAFSLPGVQFASQRVAIIDIDVVIGKLLGFKVAGILGYDFLSRVITRVDYAAREVSFYDPKAFEYNGDGVVLDAPLSKQNIFLVPLTVDGATEGVWSLDLGATGTSFNYPFAKKRGYLDRDGIDGVAFGAGGGFDTRHIQVDSVSFAGLTVPERIMTFSTKSNAGALAGGEQTGNIGNTLLRHFTLYLDYHNQRLIVEKGDDFGKQLPPRLLTGLQLSLDDSGRIAIHHVMKGTSADEAGLAAGDIILSVGGRPVAEYGGLVGTREAFQGEPGSKVAVEVQRNGEKKKVTFKRFDPFERL